MDGSNTDIQQQFATNLFSGEMVMVLFAVIIIMIIDRIVYSSYSFYEKEEDEDETEEVEENKEEKKEENEFNSDENPLMVSADTDFRRRRNTGSMFSSRTARPTNTRRTTEVERN